MRHPARALLTALLIASCAEPPVEEPSEAPGPATALVEATLRNPSEQTLDQLAEDVAPLELVFSHTVEAPGIELDKYTFALDGVPVEGAGVRVLRNGAEEGRVVRALKLDRRSARSMRREPRIAAEQAEALAIAQVATRPGRGLAATPEVRKRSLVFLAQVEDDPTRDHRVIGDLRLTYQIEVAEAPERSIPEHLAVVDAATGELVEVRSTMVHATATGQGFFEANTTLEVQPTLVGSPPVAGWCLADLTRGDNVVNANPCGTDVGPGLHTFVDLPNPERTERAVDTDMVFGNNVFPYNRLNVVGDAADTVAADAHHSIGVAYDFYRTVFYRRLLGTNDSLIVRVNTTAGARNAFFMPPSTILVGDRLVLDPLCPPTNLDCGVPPADIEALTHEYTHAVLAAEIQMPVPGSEFGALHEGIADVFALLADSWWRQPPRLESVPTPTTWVTYDRTMPPPMWRLFEKPSLGGAGAIDFWTLAVPAQLATGALGVHPAGGIMRRAFYFLAMGVAPASTAGDNTSAYLPAGVTGIGVDAAAHILYHAVATQIDPGTNPTFLDMRDAMVKEAEFSYSRCSVQAKAVMDAWAAVNVGPRADRVGPHLSITASQAGAGIQVLGHALVPLGEARPTASLYVDGVLREAEVPVSWASTGGGMAEWVITPAPVALAWLSPGAHSFELRVTDDCGNESKLATSVIQDSAPPADLSATDINKFRSPVRVFRIQAVDADLASYELRVGTRTTGPVFLPAGTHSLFNVTAQLDLSDLTNGYYTKTLIVRDTGGRQTTTSSLMLVDRQKPSNCAISAVASPTNPRDIIATLKGFNASANATPIEILDVWFDNQPFFWTDRNYPPGSPRHMTPEPSGGGSMTTTIPSATYGSHQLLGKCFDSWGNQASATMTFLVARAPTIIATATPQTGHFTVSAQVSSTQVNIDRIELWEAGALRGNKACGNTSKTCSTTFSLLAAAGETRTVTVSGYDQAGRRTNRQLTVTMPLPAPPTIVDIVKTGPARYPTLTVTTTETDRVELVIGGAVASTDFTAPFAFPLDLTGWATGTHNLEFRAYDVLGRVATRPYSMFVDSTPPIVSVSIHGNQPPYLIEASVIDLTTAVVYFKLDGVVFKTVNSGAYQAWYTPADTFSHTITVEAVDLFFNSGSASIDAPVGTGDNPPVVNGITVSYTSPKRPRLQIDATDDMAVTRVDILRAGSVIATANTAPWIVDLDTSGWPDGSHVITARAYDAAGHSSESTVTIEADNTAPVVGMTGVHVGMGNIVWTATVSDASTIDDVTMGAFSLVPLQHFSAPPYQIVTPGLAASSWQVWVTATARDSFGNEGQTQRLATVNCTDMGSGLRVCSIVSITQ